MKSNVSSYLAHWDSGVLRHIALCSVLLDYSCAQLL